MLDDTGNCLFFTEYLRYLTDRASPLKRLRFQQSTWQRITVWALAKNYDCEDKELKFVKLANVMRLFIR